MISFKVQLRLLDVQGINLGKLLPEFRATFVGKGQCLINFVGDKVLDQGLKCPVCHAVKYATCYTRSVGTQ